jgi:hypothetical protein
MMAIAPVVVFSPMVGEPQAAIAQIIRMEGVGQKVYTELPDFPRENQYINKETGKVAEDDTLVTRLVRYHLYVRGRPPFYRLDWKLTLADYLGLSGRIDESDYPSAKKLNKNPFSGDLAVIRNLNLAQRNALVQALVNAFTPQTRSPQAVPKPVIKLPPAGNP